MDWLTRLPVVGPTVSWALRTRIYRAVDLFLEAGSNRLAGAMTFFGFLALFPTLTVAMAVAAAVLAPSQVQHLQQKIGEQVPALSQSIDLNAVVRNAGTLGVVSGALLLVSGLGWVGTARASIREVWRLPVAPDNPVLRKALDVGVLLGLGLVAGVSVASSSLATALAGQAAHSVGIDRHSVGKVLLQVAGFAIAVGADTILFGYLLVGLPRLRHVISDEGRRAVVEGALLGGVGFELLKLLLTAYLREVATRNVYGAFGTPVALLLWINFIFRWLLFCSAWTATAVPAGVEQRARDRAEREWEEAGAPGRLPAAVPPAPPAPEPAPVPRFGRPRWTGPAFALAFVVGAVLGRRRGEPSDRRSGRRSGRRRGRAA